MTFLAVSPTSEGLARGPRRAEILLVTNVLDRMNARYVDICGLDIDAIVNPAHADLLGGGGLDGMIHDAAGLDLLDACRALNGCKVGEAKTTPGFNLSARWVIHTVGPIWRGGNQGEAQQQLASCYRRCMEEAVAVEAASLAFPGISTGLHRFPVELSAVIAVREVSRFLMDSDSPRTVLFACFDNTSLTAYERLLGGSV